jgi:hypothetical protein
MNLRNEINADNEDTSELSKVRRQRDSAKHELDRVREELDSLRRSLEVVSQVERTNIKPPKWLAPTATKKTSATLVVMLSDLHLDEVVNPDEVDGLNAYNREIARLRLRKWANNVIKMARDHFNGVSYDGVVILLGGDIFSGDIHEELKETNSDTLLGSMLFWSEELAAAIDMLLTEFKQGQVVSVVGNHGRTTRKPRAKLRARTNFDWLLAKMLERHFTKDKRVNFIIPEGADAYFEIYGQGHLLTHGDQTNGGGGIGGIWPPVMRLRARKAERYLAVGGQFLTLWMGHWHQYISTPSLVVNGSLKGVDEYAFLQNFRYELPQQALAIVAPNHNITVHAPVFCVDRKAEGW